MMLYKAGQYTAYRDSQYSAVCVDISSQGYSAVTSQYTVHCLKAGQQMFNSIRYIYCQCVSAYYTAAMIHKIRCSLLSFHCKRYVTDD